MSLLFPVEVDALFRFMVSPLFSFVISLLFPFVVSPLFPFVVSLSNHDPPPVLRRAPIRKKDERIASFRQSPCRDSSNSQDD